jgi:hypothetical protein
MEIQYGSCISQSDQSGPGHHLELGIYHAERDDSLYMACDGNPGGWFLAGNAQPLFGDERIPLAAFSGSCYFHNPG